MIAVAVKAIAIPTDGDCIRYRNRSKERSIRCREYISRLLAATVNNRQSRHRDIIHAVDSIPGSCILPFQEQVSTCYHRYYRRHRLIFTLSIKWRLRCIVNIPFA